MKKVQQKAQDKAEQKPKKIAKLLKQDLAGNVHFEKEQGQYYVIFNVNSKQPFYVELDLLDRLVENYKEIAKAQGDYKNDGK